MNQRQTNMTLRLQRLIDNKIVTKQFIYLSIGMSKETLSTRLKKSNWKLCELIALDVIKLEN